ncbi:rhodanese-like domain-containing protein [Ornithinibacillus gellani]|nr:rhodanese-like domain-containing protein [Ornithinibacillus gellani]
MKNVIKWIIILLFVGIVISRILPAKGVDSRTPQEIQTMLEDKDIQFIDVRTPGEFAQLHQKPFRNIPLAELSKRMGELDQDKEVVLICQTGMRSMQAAKKLKKNGFKKITNVHGGMSSWI